MTLLRLFLTSAGRLLLLALRALNPGPGDLAGGVRRLAVMLCFVPLFALVQLMHWIGFLLDELLFPGYRRVEIREPLFVLGVPRSGTTHLHRILALDPRFTTFSTWECLLALSVTERRLWMGLARLDARLGGPLARAMRWLEGRIFGALAEVHSMGLEAPEEDYFAFMPVLACFILILLFPADPAFWRMAGFDRELPLPERRRLMAFYRGCLQRHLYAHGGDRRLLSKNAAFAPLAGSLLETFPDARFLVCLREPERTVPSQLSSIESGLALFASLRIAPELPERLAERLAFYYENLARTLGEIPPSRCAWLTMADLKADLSGAVSGAYRQLGIGMDPELALRLAAAAAESRAYRSAHSYSLEGLSPRVQALASGLRGTYEALAARSVLGRGTGSVPHPEPRSEPRSEPEPGPDEAARAAAGTHSSPEPEAPQPC